MASNPDGYHRFSDDKRRVLDSSTESDEEAGPKDPRNFVLWSMFLFGIASLLPWNFFITATQYWNYKFRNITQDPDDDTQTRLQKDFNAYLSIASKVPYILFLVVNTAITQRVALKHRIIWPLVACIVLFIVTSALVEVDTDNNQYLFLGITLTLVVLINVFCGVLQGGGTGLAGCLPQRYMVSNTYGQGAGGIFATLCQIGVLLLGSSAQTAGLLYFLLAVVFLIVCLVCFMIVLKMDFTHFYLSRQVSAAENTGIVRHRQRTDASVPYLRIFHEGWEFYVGVVVIYWVTIGAFPTLCTPVKSQAAESKTSLATTFFLPLACFLNFNIVSVLGRVAASYIPIPPKGRRWILAFCVLRIAFIPLLLLCNAPSPHRTLPIWFPYDWQYILIIALFAFTNGYATNLVMVYACKSSSTEYEEVAGSLSALFLGLGLCLGAISSLGLVNLVK